LQKFSDSQLCIVTHVGPMTYWYGIYQKRSGGMVWSLQGKCRCGIALSHSIPLPAMIVHTTGNVVVIVRFSC